MWLKFLCIVITLCCASCSLPKQIETTATSQAEKKSDIFRLHLEQWGEPKFSGLITLTNMEDGLSTILLDGTGIKLLSLDIKPDGSYKIIKGIKKIKESLLPGFLASALSRMYLISPASRPCSYNMLMALCLTSEDNGHWLQKAAFQPLTLWSVNYTKEPRPGLKPAATYSQPWIGIKMQLRPID